MAAGLDPLLLALTAICLAIIPLGFFLHKLKQPFIIAYILAGVILGPSILNWLPEVSVLEAMGGLGIILLMFFLGMEISLPKLLKQWKVPVIGTTLQIALSVAAMWLISLWTGISLKTVILLGFILTLSSTAVVVRLLDMRNMHDTKTGQRVLGVLLAQDIAIAPMLIVVGLLSGGAPTGSELLKLAIGGTLTVGLVAILVTRKRVRWPLPKLVKEDHTLQLFLALLVCFGFASVTGYLGISTAIGAFIAGMYVAGADETHWVHEKLHTLHILFIAIFFVAIGTIIDLSFVLANWIELLGLLAFVFIVNTAINAGILYLLGGTIAESLEFGGLLAQVGEFSLVLAGVGVAAALLDARWEQMIIAVICSSLILSPFWVELMRKIGEMIDKRTTRVQ